METDPNVSADLAHKLPAGVSLLARDGVVLNFGPGMIEALCPTGACPVGARLSDLVAEPDRGVAEAALTVLVEGKETRAEIAVRRRAATASGEPVGLTLVAVRDHGETVAVVLELAQNPGAASAAAAADVKAPNVSEALWHMTETTIGVPWSRCPQTGSGRIFSGLPTRPGNLEALSTDAMVLAGITLANDMVPEQATFAPAPSGDTGTFWHDLQVQPGGGSWRGITLRIAAAAGADRGPPPPVRGCFTEIDRLQDDEHLLAAASEEICHAHGRLNALADTFPGALFEFNGTPDGAGHFHYTSARFAEILGIGPTRFEQDANAVFSVVKPEELARVRATAHAAVRDRKAFRTEVQIEHPPGGPRWLMVSASVADEDDGSVTWYGTLLDITEQKATAERAADADAAVRAQQARMNTLAKNAPCALYEYRVDTNGFVGFDYCSSRFPEVFGISAEALESDPAAFRRHVPAEDLEMVQAVIAEGARSLKPITFKHRIDHPDRGLRWLMVAGTPVKQPDGSVTIYSSTLDVTEATLSERRADAAAVAVRKTNERFIKLTENAPGALFEHRRHPNGREEFHFVSSTLLDIMGVTLTDVRADAANMFARVPQEDRDKVRAAMARSAETQARVEFTHRVMHPEDGVRWVLVAFETVPQPDGGQAGYGSVVDITERRETENRAAQAVEDLAHAHERLTYLTDGATVGLFETRMRSDGGMEFPYTSARFEDLIGYTSAEIGALCEGILARIDPDDLARVRKAIARSHRELRPIQVRFRLRHPERGSLWLEVSAGAPKAEGGGFTWVAALHDVTCDVKREHDLRQAHRVAEKMRARNEQQALHDGLTGLPNRRYFDDVIAEHRTQAQRGGPGDCTLVRLDLDRFKHVNDTMGHAAGDKVLVRVAEVLRDCARVGDFPSRNGGDEFSILMATGATEHQAREVAGRVQRELAKPLIHEGRQCRFGASFGIAHTDNILETGDDIHLFADAALYRAKVEGGNRTEAFTPQLQLEIHRDRSLAIAIHEALEKDELVPYFQPQIRAADGSLFGAEVLLRWNHPTEGILAPGAFMHVAEQLRLVPDIDRAMMEASCDVLSRWRAQGLVVPKISFNVSSGRMHDPDILGFASRFAEIDTRVTFELLESILVEEENQAFRDNLNIIRDAGVDIEIDDFGSGHASIIGLMEIEPTALKIDQRIVFPVVRDRRARDLVHAIVDIARALGINTVAEGVETEAHARILRETGCGVLQGYHYAKPLSEAQFLDYARAHHDPAV